MSGIYHTVRVISITDHPAATIYTGTITYPMSVVKQFIAAVPNVNTVAPKVFDDNDTLHLESTASNVIRHINAMVANRSHE